MGFETVLLAVLGTAPENWLLFFACLAVSAAIGKFADYFIARHLRKIAQTNPIGSQKLNEIVLGVLEKPLWLVFVVIGFLIGLSLLNIPAETMKLIHQTLGVVAILIITWIIVRAVDFILKGYLMPLAARAGSKIDGHFLPILSKPIKIIIVVIAIAAIAGSFGYDLTAVLAGIGIGGLAIAFAAQATIADIFGGFSIFTSKHFAIGDVIHYEDKKMELKVEQIGLRYSYFRDADGRRVIIPNSKIANTMITNISSERKTRTVLNIALAFDTPIKKIEKAKRLVRQAIESEKLCEKNPLVAFSDFKDWGSNIQAIYYIKDKKNVLEIRDSINSRIKSGFDKEKIFFGFPGRGKSQELAKEDEKQKNMFDS